jgi:phospholipid/cholesterol/gamma-HCH transport system substrate-binding protein
MSSRPPAPPEDEEEDLLPTAPAGRGRDQAVWVGFFLVLGFVAILAALFILTDAAFFRGRYIVTTTVPTAGGIRRGDPVQMRGVNIGRIQRFKIEKDKVEIRMELEGEYDVPVDSHVVLKSAGLLGGMIADIVPGDDRKFIGQGDQLPGTVEQGIFDAANRIATQAETIMTRVESLLSQETIRNVSTTTGNAAAATADLRRLIAQVSTAVTDQRRELNALSTTLQKSAQGVERITTGPEMTRTLERLDTLGQRMDGITTSLSTSSKSMETVTGRIARGEGSLGKATMDDELYRNLNQAALNINQATQNINQLTAEIRKNPTKYLKMSVF